MKAKFSRGPLHNQELEVGEDPPQSWMAADFREPDKPFRPVTSPWDDLTAPIRITSVEYERRDENDGRIVYLAKTVHRPDGTKLEL